MFYFAQIAPVMMRRSEYLSPSFAASTVTNDLLNDQN